MVSPTKIVLQKVQHFLPETRLCKDVLAVSPTKRILRGFIFDRSIMPGMYYLWAFVMPLYTPKPFVFLNYGDRLAQGETFHITRDNVDDVSERIAAVIADGTLDRIRNIDEPKRFFSHFKRPLRVHLLDFGLTHYVLGRPDQCLRMLEKDAQRLSPHRSKRDWVEEALLFLEELKADPSAAARRIENWESANVDKLGLAKAMGKIP
ncbi:MAG TPA: hypothetical protein VJQ55_01350 [Candidatus Binatia bacterium]|nr:hypothetical protein [Candidatus Binatia bacterium]